jgi:hypothetical protein
MFANKALIQSGERLAERVFRAVEDLKARRGCLGPSRIGWTHETAEQCRHGGGYRPASGERPRYPHSHAASVAARAFQFQGSGRIPRGRVGTADGELSVHIAQQLGQSVQDLDSSEVLSLDLRP